MDAHSGRRQLDRHRRAQFAYGDHDALSPALGHGQSSLGYLFGQVLEQEGMWAFNDSTSRFAQLGIVDRGSQIVCTARGPEVYQELEVDLERLGALGLLGEGPMRPHKPEALQQDPVRHQRGRLRPPTGGDKAPGAGASGSSTRGAGHLAGLGQLRHEGHELAAFGPIWRPKRRSTIATDCAP